MDPCKRALLQRDLWMLFDTVAPSRWLIAPAAQLVPSRGRVRCTAGSSSCSSQKTCATTSGRKSSVSSGREWPKGGWRNRSPKVDASTMVVIDGWVSIPPTVPGTIGGKRMLLRIKWAIFPGSAVGLLRTGAESFWNGVIDVDSPPKELLTTITFALRGMTGLWLCALLRKWCR